MRKPSLTDQKSAAISAPQATSGLAQSLNQGIIIAIAIMIGLGALATNASVWADNALRGVRDQVREHSASGQVVILEIDARSISKLNDWPWPRSHYADAIDTLSNANARTIAFDVDVSAQSNPGDDRHFSDALSRAGGAVILPVFRQLAGSGRQDMIESLPALQFRDSAMLASVNIHPESDGIIRLYPLGTRIADVPRPSLGAMVAEARGAVTGRFRIDGAINPDTIPRISFIDLIEGRVPANLIQGRRVIVGATAIELGDRYAFAGRGVLPGVVVQALAAETLINGVVPKDYGALPALIVAIIGIVILVRSRSNRQAALRGMFITATVLTLPLIVEIWTGHSLSVGPALFAVFTAIILGVASTTIRTILDSRTIDAETGLGNLMCLASNKKASLATRLAVLRLEHFEDIAATIGIDGRAALFQRLADRISNFSNGATVYRVQTTALGWYADTLSADDLDEALQGLSAILNAPIQIGDRKVDLRAHIGVADITGGDVRGAVTHALLAADASARAGLRWLQHSG
jgi:diguanylate cyclase